MALTEADKTVVKQIIEIYIKHDATLFKDEVNHLIRETHIQRDKDFAALKVKTEAHIAEPLAGVDIEPIIVEIQQRLAN